MVGMECCCKLPIFQRFFIFPFLLCYFFATNGKHANLINTMLVKDSFSFLLCKIQVVVCGRLAKYKSKSYIVSFKMTTCIRENTEWRSSAELYVVRFYKMTQTHTHARNNYFVRGRYSNIGLKHFCQ